MKWTIAAAGVFVAGVAFGQAPTGEQPKQPAGTGTESKAPEVKAPEVKAPEIKAQESWPSAESLFEKHIAAIGGLEAIKGERNRLVRAKFSAPAGAAEGGLRVIRVAPNRMAQILEIPGMMTQEMWYNGEEGWQRDSNTGTSRLKGDALVDLRMQADILGECNYKSRYKEIKTLGPEQFAGVVAYAVRAVSPEGRERTLYFDSKAGYLIGVRSRTQQGVDSVVTMSEYKKFGETLHPTKSVVKVGDAEAYTVTISQVESNLAVPPTVNPPDEVKAVK
jgi:hypothetical protein